MEEELKRKVKMAAKQIVEVKKYAKLYQDNFRKQADEYIKVLKQETVEKNQNQENNLNMSLKKCKN